MVLGKVEAPCQRIILQNSATPYTKINAKWIKDLKVRHETIKLIEETISIKFFDIDLSNFFGYASLGKRNKSKINKWSYIKLKILCTLDETINKANTPVMEWKKIFLCDTPDEGLTSKIYKELTQLNIEKTTWLKWVMFLNRHYPKDYRQMADGHRKRCQKSLINKKIQLKTTIRYSPHTWQNSSH